MGATRCCWKSSSPRAVRIAPSPSPRFSSRDEPTRPTTGTIVPPDFPPLNHPSKNHETPSPTPPNPAPCLSLTGSRISSDPVIRLTPHTGDRATILARARRIAPLKMRRPTGGFYVQSGVFKSPNINGGANPSTYCRSSMTLSPTRSMPHIQSGSDAFKVSSNSALTLRTTMTGLAAVIAASCLWAASLSA